MKLLFAYRYGNLGGVSAQLLSRLSGFSTQPDVEVHLAFVEDHGVSAELANTPNVLFESSPKKIAAYCRRAKIDVISVIDTPEVLEAVLASPGRASVLLEVHTTYEESLSYLERIPTGVGAIVVPSAYSEKLVRKRLQREIPIRVVRNCVDGTLFHPHDVAAPASPICLWVGKLDEHKNWRGFVEVAQRLHAKRDDLSYWIVGGATATPQAKEDLMLELYRSRLVGRVRWLDWVPRADMPAIYNAVAASGGVSLVTSRNESFGMSIAESLLCGCPVVATNVGAIAEISSGEGALQLYEFGDTDSAAAITLATLESGPTGSATRQAWHDELAPAVSPREVCLSFRAMAAEQR